ncbi:sulfatase-like hydrolase/transferase [Acidobacteria bacterium AH-259-O06]|nr:sulfatase-like hydrolase/transferase [Acidobacteria bacterium AH-259-O06]
MRVSAGTEVGVGFAFGTQAPAPLDMVSMPLVPGDEFHTYRLTYDASNLPLGVPRIQLEPTDAPDATFAIESIRLISRREHLATIATGPGWHGLGGINRETIVSRSPQRVRFEVDLASQPWLDLAVGTIEDGSATFTVEIGSTTLLRRTVTLPQQWEDVRLDLNEFAGQQVTLSLGLEADQPGRLGFWGAPVVRHSGVLPERSETSSARAALPDAGTAVPQGVILILADTLRRDHLDAYGYERPTAPVLARLASEGALFSDNISQAPWTKPSVPSILSSLYPSTHGVVGYSDLLPSSVVTLAEAYRDAGYATFHTSSNSWAGTPSRLQQGVEVLHEDRSLYLDDAFPSKTARAIVTRFLDWLDRHDDVPFFAFLHFFDPHLPYEPYSPYDTMWAPPSSRAEHEARWQRLEEAGVGQLYVSDDNQTPAIALLQKAEVDPEAFLAHQLAWYDGSIRAMDVEIGRLLEGLESHGLGDKTLLAFISDHGEEILDHGYIGHGGTSFGEVLNVPLLLWWPGVLPAGTVIEETVESIDLMPTLLDLSGLATVEGMQGQSLLPLLARPDAPSSIGWVRRGAFGEKHPGGPSVVYLSTLVLDGWKLIQNPKPLNPGAHRRHHGRPEYELYAHDADPLDQRNVASEHPEVVERLAEELNRRRQFATASRIPPDDVPMESFSSEALRRLRALGYLR